MKRAIFTFFASFFACFSGAQMLPDSIEWYYYDPIKKEYTASPVSTDIYKYDHNGNVLEEITQAASLNSFNDSSVVYGKIEDYFNCRYDKDSMNFVMYGSRHCRFDLHENEIRDVHLKWVDGLPDTMSVELHLYTYGSSGEIIERVIS